MFTPNRNSNEVDIHMQEQQAPDDKALEALNQKQQAQQKQEQESQEFQEWLKSNVPDFIKWSETPTSKPENIKTAEDLKVFAAEYPSVARSFVKVLEKHLELYSSETQGEVSPLDRLGDRLIHLILEHIYPTEILRIVFEKHMVAFFLNVFDSTEKLLCFQTQFQDFKEEYESNKNTWEDFTQHIGNSVKKDARLLAQWNLMQQGMQAPRSSAPETGVSGNQAAKNPARPMTQSASSWITRIGNVFNSSNRPAVDVHNGSSLTPKSGGK